MSNDSKASKIAAPIPLADEDPLDAYFIGKIEIVGDIISPAVPYEDYTFDENNLFPEEWAAREAASQKKD